MDEIGFLSGHVAKLAQGTRQSSDVPRIRIVQEDHTKFGNPNDYFPHLLSTVNGRLYFWDKEQKQWIDPYKDEI